MALFFSTILTFKIHKLDDLLYILINNNLYYLIQFIFSLFLYKYTIDIFLNFIYDFETY